ncbi:MAG: peptidylprolyl isomerase [endosymbiont of Escarpia spicata]|uniref:Peptidyl-prolyl cis-trans isomerase n=1 Tax=endosymbiont of Escarpia spicata TaxID=2200908 RepID=A0A370DAY0_9GAMM|nr:MAG: peptidylprolyl isomerase [endosymbiont of Escarpia spicata]
MNENRAEIIPGSGVTMHFSLTLPDGTEAISTYDDEPLTFNMGDGNMIPGLELALYGLRPGMEQTLMLTADQAFGTRDEEKVHPVPREDFPQEMVLEPGQVVAFNTPAGDELAGIILTLEETRVVVDFNHPLAGREVSFRVSILDVQPPVTAQTTDGP